VFAGYQTEMEDVDAARFEVDDAPHSSVLLVDLAESARVVVADPEEVFEESEEAAYTQLVEVRA
jgi:hypothetical protein